MDVPEDDQPDRDLIAQWMNLVQGIQATHELVLAGVEEIGIPAQWFAVLQLLDLAPDQRLPMSTIARRLPMSTGGFTKLADRLARDGLIDRRGSAGDRRVVYATLTDHGRALARAGAKLHADAVRTHVLGTISLAELQVAAELVTRLGEAAAAHVTGDADQAAAGSSDGTDRADGPPPVERRRRRDDGPRT